MSDDKNHPIGDEAIPTPRSEAELIEWIHRMSNLLKEITDHDEQRDIAVAAVTASFDTIIKPRRTLFDLLTAGVSTYVFENEATLKKRHGLEFAVGSAKLKFDVAGYAVEVKSGAETARALEAIGRQDLVRYQPKPYETGIKANRLNKAVRAALDRTGAYVARHLFATLALPGSEEPVQLYKRRFPRPGRPHELEED